LPEAECLILVGGEGWRSLDRANAEALLFARCLSDAITMRLRASLGKR
jgi:hypothetical protein